MFDEFLNKAAEVLATGEPFVTASVVRFQPPISGKPGDKAIIYANGKIWGGGSVAGAPNRSSSRKPGRRSGTGRPRLV